MDVSALPSMLPPLNLAAIRSSASEADITLAEPANGAGQEGFGHTNAPLEAGRYVTFRSQSPVPLADSELQIAGMQAVKIRP